MELGAYATVQQHVAKLVSARKSAPSLVVRHSLVDEDLSLADERRTEHAIAQIGEIREAEMELEW